MILIVEKPIYECIYELRDVFKKYGYKLHLVGGCVRDMIMGIEPHDYDMCTNATPDEMIKMCEKEKYKYLNVGKKYGTVTIHIGNEWFEVTTYRTDGNYSDGRHPDDVVFAVDIEQDLMRRDFTINAIAIDLETNKIVDPYHGVDDIINGTLRAVGNPFYRLTEDRLRMLRALRFKAKYDLSVDPELHSAIYELSDSITSVSKERITEEFRKLFVLNKPLTQVLNIPAFQKLLITIIPDLKRCIGMNQNSKYHRHDLYNHILAVVDGCNTTDFSIKMAALLHDIGKPDAYVEDEDGHGHFYGHPTISAELSAEILKQSFRVSNEEEKRILELVAYHDMDIAETKRSMRKALNKHGEDFMRDWFILKQSDMNDHIYPDNTHMRTVASVRMIMEEVLNAKEAFSIKDLDIDGNIIMKELNIKEGKIVGIILNKLLEDVIDGKVENNQSDLLFAARGHYTRKEN